MGERPEGTSLGRILDMGNYEQGNCFWMTPAEQNLAKRNRFHLLVFINNTPFKCGHRRTPENIYANGEGKMCKECACARRRLSREMETTQQ